MYNEAPKKISLLAPFRENAESDDSYAAYEAARRTEPQDSPRGGEVPSDGGAGLDSAPRPRRAFGWTSNDGIRGLLKYAANPTKRVPTGMWQLDNLIGGGVGLGEVCVIVGKSGSGKSLVGQNMVENNLEVPTVFFSFEMPGTMLLTRSLAMWSGRTHDQVFTMVETNTLDSEMLSDWEDAHRNSYFVTRTGLDLAAMSQTLKEAEEAIGARPALVVIDYMELVASVAGGETIDNVTSVAQALKGWAKEEEVACVILHQTNKSLRHGDAPDEDSARYGGFTEADIVIGVWRPHKWQPKNKGDVAMPQSSVDYYRGFFGINLIKNRPKIDLHEQGYLVPVSAAGKTLAPKGTVLTNVTSQSGVGYSSNSNGNPF